METSAVRQTGLRPRHHNLSNVRRRLGPRFRNTDLLEANERNINNVTTPQVGMIVQDTTMGQRYTGRITRVSSDGHKVHVQWHNTYVIEEWPIQSLNILS